MIRFGVIVPVYNEERNIEVILDQLTSMPEIGEIVVVDDGSVDKTVAKVESRMKGNNSHIKLISSPINQGKGAAVRLGIENAQSEFLIIQDADQEYNPKELTGIFNELKMNPAHVVFGSRFLRENPNIYPMYLLGNKILTRVINFLGRGQLTDSYTGYKGMSRIKWKELNLNSSGFELEAEITMKCLIKKWTIKEIPISYSPRTFNQGKKIRAHDAIKGLLTAVQCRIQI